MTNHGHADHACGGSTLGRRNFMRGCGAAAAIAAAGLSAETVAAESHDLGTLLADLPDNWGRWGDDDELGALNLLGSEQTFDGMNAAMRRGRTGVRRFTLQLPMTGDTIDVLAEGAEPPTTETGDPLFPGRTPGRRDNGQDARSYAEGEVEPELGGMKFSDDRFVTELFLHGTTHMDALAHAWYDDEVYNGADEMVTADRKEFDRPVPGCADGEPVDVRETYGHSFADIAPIADAGVAGRGVLLDVGRVRGDDRGWLDLGEPVTLEDLLTTADVQGVELRKRDVVLIRTGSLERVRDPDAAWDPLNEPGLVFSEELVRWVHEMEIPLIGADNVAVEKVVQTVDGDTYVIPLHGALLRDLGVSLTEVLRLDELGAQCADDGIYDFLFTAAPLHVERATGGPVNPVVLKATGPEKRRKSSAGRP